MPNIGHHSKTQKVNKYEDKTDDISRSKDKKNKVMRGKKLNEY